MNELVETFLHWYGADEGTTIRTINSEELGYERVPQQARYQALLSDIDVIGHWRGRYLYLMSDGGIAHEEAHTLKR